MQSPTARPDQENIIQTVALGFQNHTRGQIHMPCGTGKTFIGYWIAQALQARNVLVLVPSKALVDQLAQGWQRCCPDLDVLRVCHLRAAPEDVPMFLAKSTQCTRVVFCTYQSAPALHGIFDLTIFDEAHRTTGIKTKHYGRMLHDNVQFKSTRRVFMTATPRSALPATASSQFQGMDDLDVYGPVLASMSFADALDANLVTDYHILISVVRASEYMQDFPELQTRNGLLIAQQIAVRRAMEKYNLHRAFSFHNLIEHARAFANGPQTLKGVECFHINQTTTTRSREELFEKFKQAPRALLTNARCLGEGIDMPDVDLVVFTRPKRSPVDIVQNCGRALRKTPGKQAAYILLPVFVRENDEAAENAIACAQFKHVYNTLNALRDVDKTFAAEIIKPTARPTNTQRHVDFSRIVFDFGDVETVSQALLDKLHRAISVKLLRPFKSRVRLSPQVHMQHLLDLIAAGASKPKTNDSDPKLRKLALYIAYTPEMRAEAHRLAPQWFSERKKTLGPKKPQPIGAIVNYKALLLTRANNGAAKPDIRIEPQLHDKLQRYTNPHDREYDPEFTTQLQIAAPHWLALHMFETPQFQALFKHAQAGGAKPSETAVDLQTRKLAWTLHALQKIKQGREHIALLRAVAPIWFA